MVGLAGGQVARVNAANIASGRGLNSACPAEIFFLDAQGKVVKTRKAQLDPGIAAFLDWIAPMSLESRAGSRFALRSA